MARHVRYLLLGLLVATSLQVPADAANREHQQMAADIRMLQEQTQQLQLAIAALSDAIKAVSGKIDEQNSIARKGFADQKLGIDTVSGDIRIVREKVDETNVRISSLSQEVEALRLSIPPAPPPAVAPIDQQTGQPAEPGAAAPPAAPETGAPAEPPPAAPPSLAGMHPQRQFDTAFADFAAGNMQLAIAGFEAVLRTFPKSDVADDAQFLIGDSLLYDNKFKEAVAAYDRLISGYPSSDRVPEAYYKRGMAYEKLGDAARARESYETVIKNYPNTPAAGLAKQVLDRLSRR